MNLLSFPKNEAGLPIVPLSEYNALSPNLQRVWDKELNAWPEWGEKRGEYMGKRAILDARSYIFEDLHFVIDSNL